MLFSFFENLGKRFIPSHHAAVRVVIQKTDILVQAGQTHSELNVQRSRFLFNFETVQPRSPGP